MSDEETPIELVNNKVGIQVCGKIYNAEKILLLEYERDNYKRLYAAESGRNLELSKINLDLRLGKEEEEG